MTAHYSYTMQIMVSAKELTQGHIDAEIMERARYGFLDAISLLACRDIMTIDSCIETLVERLRPLKTIAIIKLRSIVETLTTHIKWHRFNMFYYRLKVSIVCVGYHFSNI